MGTNTERESLAISAAAKRLAGEALIAEASKMEAKLAASRRPEPASDQNRWVIDVRFSRTGKLYEYLVLRVGGRYYTTGTDPESATFPNWRSFLEWLDDNTVAHSAMIPVKADYTVDAALEGRNHF